MKISSDVNPFTIHPLTHSSRNPPSASAKAKSIKSDLARRMKHLVIVHPVEQFSGNQLTADCESLEARDSGSFFSGASLVSSTGLFIEKQFLNSFGI